MFKDALIDYLSEHRAPVSSVAVSEKVRRFDLATYSVWSTSDREEVIFAFTDCYVDELVVAGRHPVDTVVFSLNAFALGRESFRLNEELALTQLAESRLEPAYVEKLIIEPLVAAVTAAEASAAFAARALDQAEKRFEVGLVAITDVMDAKYLATERAATLSRARIDKQQRELELAAQQRRLVAEKTDLQRRIDLNAKVAEAHRYRLRRAAELELHTFPGAFVEEGDPICTVSYA